MRQKAIDRIRCTYQVTCNPPTFIYRNLQYLGSQLLGYPSHIVFILFMVEGTSTVYEQTARFQCWPDIGQDAALAFPTDIHIFHTPLVYRHLVLSEHPLSRTRHVSQNHIKQMRQFGKIDRIVVRHHDFRMPPFGEIFSQNLRTVTHYLIGHQQTAFGQHASTQSRLTPRSGAKVKHYHRLLHIFAQHPFHKHGRSFLHIIASGMEKRVKGKSRTIFEINTYRRCPRNRFTYHRLIGLRTIRTHANGCFDT